MKILVLSCSTGEGHNSAAKAIKDNLRERNVECEIKDVLTFKSEKASEKVAAIYNTVIRKVPAVFGLAYTLGGVYDKLNLPSPIYSVNAKYADKLYGYIIEGGFNSVICTHLFAMEAMTAVKKIYGLSVGSYGVLTDYTTVPFYKDTLLDGYFVPNEAVGRQLNKDGIPQDRIFCTGIPIHSKFLSSTSKKDARAKLNIPQDKKIVAVMFGGAGCGKVVKLCKKLDKALDDNCLVLTFPARNEKLKSALDEKFGSNGKFTIVPFTDEIHLYLKAVDVVISKPGGLSSTEIAVLNVPLVHVKTIPGLETANVKYFSKSGLSVRADTLNSAVKCTAKLLSDEILANRIKTNQRLLICAEATDLIVEKVTETNDENIFMATVYNGRVYLGQHDVLQDYSEAIAK